MGKKGLIIYDTIYSSTIEVSFWIKALIGEDQHVDVKHQDQVLTITPYDYIIIGSFTRMEKPSKRTLAFI
jgi:menaquinone-dependent protoporphyrinogen IX oxidase